MPKHSITLDDPNPIADFGAFEQNLKDQLGLDDQWVYHTTGWMRNDFHDELIDIIGDDNIRFISSATKTVTKLGGRKEHYTRTSIFVNDEGRARIKEYLGSQGTDE